MTIVFFCRLFYPHIGGVEKHVREVGKRFAKDGHRLIVITESSSEVYPQGTLPLLREMIDGMEVFRIPVGSSEKGKKWVIWRWMWAHREIWQKSDILHFHDVFFWYLPFRLLNPWKKAYMTFHGYESYPIRHGAIWMRKIAEKLTWGNICIGDFMKKWYGTHPTYVSYGAVSIGEGQKQEIPHPFSALFYGRLDHQTGILTYEAATSIINKEYTQFHVTVIGDGELSTKIDRMGMRIKFQENIEPYLKKNRYIFVSRYLSILEALAAKRLVFAVYDNPVKEDYLKMAPFVPYIVIANTPEKLAEQVIFFLKNPKEEEKKIHAGYEWVKKQTWEEMTHIYKKLWDIS